MEWVAKRHLWEAGHGEGVKWSGEWLMLPSMHLESSQWKEEKEVAKVTYLKLNPL